MDQFWNSFLKHAGEAVFYLLLIGFPYISKQLRSLWKKQSNILFHNAKVKREIEDIIYSLRIRFNANRAYLWEFSNTERSIAGFPFEFARMTYEKVQHLESVKMQYEKRHITDFLSTLLLVGEEAVAFCVVNVNDPLTPEDTRFWMQDLGIKWMVLHKVGKQLNSGVVVLQFTNDFRVETPEGKLFREDEEHLRYQALKVLKLLKSLKH